MKVFKLIPPFILTLLLSAGVNHAQTEQIKFERISVEQGLSQNTVHCMLQDRRGFLWFGTNDGLNRYDGHNFVVFRHNLADSHSISNNTIRAIIQDTAGALWIGTEAGGLNKYDPRTGRFVHWINAPDNPHSLSHNHVTSLVQDRTGVLWIGTHRGLNRFNQEMGRFDHWRCEPGRSSSLSHDIISTLLEDKNGAIWIGTESGLNRFDPQTARFRFARWLHEPGNPRSLSDSHILALHQDSSGTLWIGTYTGGLNRFDHETGEFSHWMNEPGSSLSLSHNMVNAIFEDCYGMLWLGTRGGGLNRFDRTAGTFTHWATKPGDPITLSNNDVMSIYEDRSGALWIGNFGGGLNKLDREKQKFSHCLHDAESLEGDLVYAILEDRLGMLWVGTKDGGLIQSDRTQRKFTYFRHQAGNPNSLSHNFIRDIYEDGSGAFWIATRGGGLNRLDRQTGKFRYWRHEPNNPRSLSHNEVFCIYEDRWGFLWLGTYAGLNRFDPKTETFTHWGYDPDNPRGLSNSLVWSIIEDRSGELWLGTNGGGLNLFNPQTETFHHWANKPGDAKSLSNNHVIVVFKDRAGRLWLGTYGGGLNEFERETGTFTAYRERDGLASDFIFGILEDDDGYLWLSTTHGLSRFHPAAKTFKNFDVHDGLQSNEFELGACFKSACGELFFGGNNGLSAFHPKDIEDNPYLPPVVLTDFQIFNRSVGFGPGSPSRNSISETSDLTLSYKANVFSFEFAALCYNSPEKNQYAYKMEGFDKNWIYCGNRRNVTYTNLDPGQYVFRVKAANHDGVWNEQGTAITLTITPPFWRTWWAYALYTFVFVVGMFGIIKGRVRYLEKRTRTLEKAVAERTAQVAAQAEKLKEVDRMKSGFFANISHEFRTPLTLIQGPLEQMLAGEALSHPQATYRIMLNNTRRLLQLINQLLDLSKLESGSMKLRARRENIATFLKCLVMSFASLAESRKLTLSCSAEENIELYFDPDYLEKIFNNLIANAIKFTPPGGSVKVAVTVIDGLKQPPSATATASASLIEISVRDTGIGIPAAYLPHIFDRFYQVDNSHTREHGGTGIGLALVKELVELHAGAITVQSEVGVGTEFRVRLPLGEAHLKANDIVETCHADRQPADNGRLSEFFIQTDDPNSESSLEANTPPTDNDKTIILIVEDHPEVRSFIRGRLPAYQVIEAADGREGMRAALEIIPDLIICDVMMPKLDGCKLCRLLKNDERTSHIPIILLTAKAGENSKLEGLETGADDYLIKPFNARELQARVKNLIDLRRKLREHFRQEWILQPSKIVANSMDQEFMQRVLIVVEKHLDEEEFSVEVLAGEVGMSRTQLHRKLNALTNQSASLFIRSIRLQRAADLLKQKAGTVSEIAYRVGFNSPTYFAKCFKEHFGYSPVELKKNGSTDDLTI